MSQPTLARHVGRWQVVALAINDVVGSGVYLLPAAAAAILGPSSILAVALAGVAVLLVVLCFAEAATYFDQPGGAYLYARTAFGEAVGFQVGWFAWLTRTVAIASLSVATAQALAWLWPAAGSGWGRAAVVVGSLAILTALNVAGVRFGAGAATVLAIAKVLPLLVLIVAGLGAFSPSLVAGQAPTETGGLGKAALLLLFAYAGFENTAAPAGEIRRPRADVPFALVAQIVAVTSLYVAVQVVTLGVLPDAARSATPLADAATLLLGTAGGLMLTVGAVLSIFGTVNNSVLNGPRYLFALARDGYGPGWLERIHPRFQTPAVATLFQIAIVLPLALTGSFTGLATLSIVARLATYAATAAAVPVLRRKRPEAEGFRLPGGVAIPIAALAVTIGLAASATLAELATGVAAAALGLVVFALRRRPREAAGSRVDVGGLET